MTTRKSKNKYLIEECYNPSEEFLPGRLPTLKQVIERCLYFEDYRKDSVLREVSEELFNLWVKCNVYPISSLAIQKRLNNHIKQFYRLVNYDKKKRGPTFKLDTSKFTNTSNKLFDIYIEDHKKLAIMEKKYLLKMSEEDYKFYEDQKTNRYGYCTLRPVHVTPSESKFRTRIIQENERASKAQKFDSTSKPSCSFQEPEEETQQSIAGMSEPLSSDNDPDPDYNGDDTNEQNRTKLQTLAEVCDRYQLSDRAGAAVASAALVDFGIITSNKMQNVIDKNKLRRERNKLRLERQKEEKIMFEKVTGIGFDGRKDATLQNVEINGKYYLSTILEEHYVITGEPDSFYLNHFTPKSSKGIDIAHGIFMQVKGTELEKKLVLVKADGTNVNTGHLHGSIRYLELFLGKPLQWDICLLHLNELPLRHVFMKLDGTTKGPDKFAGTIGSKLNGNVSDWEVVKFKPIPYDGFVMLDNQTVNNLSTDQYYAYRICWGVITGDVDDDLALLEVGPLNHSRWLTLACRILRFYVSVLKATKILKLITEFIVTVYFPSWFHIKINKNFTDGAKNLFYLIQKINKFPDISIRDICFKTLNYNSYFAHGENILIAMLADEDEQVRRKAVNKILCIKGIISSFDFEEDDFAEGIVESDDENETCDNESEYPYMNKDVRIFLKPNINFKASCYHKITPILEWQTIPPILRGLSGNDIKNFIQNPLELGHECHSQNVERHIKLITEASSAVVGHDRRDGLIRNKIRSRKLMKNFVSKSYFKF